MKNFFTVLMLSLGLPMFLMGDEVRRTQHGNNNAYCQDEETNWYDWSLVTKHADIHRFVRILIARRSLRDTGPERQRLTLTQVIRQAITGWHGVKLKQPDWGDDSHSIAIHFELGREGLLAYFIFNAYWEPLEFQLPRIDDKSGIPWKRWIDTFLDSPQDIVPWHTAPLVPGQTYRAGPRSVVVLWSTIADESKYASAVHLI